MAYKSFLQRLREAEEAELDVELDGPAEPVDAEGGKGDKPKKGKEGNIEDFAEDVHDIAEDLTDVELADALGQGDTADAYNAAVAAIRDLHKIVCPDCELTVDKEDKKSKGDKKSKDDGADAEDEEGKLTEAEGPQQMADVYKFFPNNAERAARALAARGDLYIGDTEIIEERMLFTVETDEHFESITEIPVDVGGDTRYLELKLSGTIGEAQASRFDPNDNELHILAEFNLDEQEFWDEFEDQFKREYGFAFDDDNEEHGRIANRIHRAIVASPVVLVTVDDHGVFVSDLLSSSAADHERRRLSR